jgi:hypothetical protein
MEGLPTTMLYDRQGILRKKVTGFEFTDTFDVDLKPFFDIRSGNITKKASAVSGESEAEASSNKLAPRWESCPGVRPHHFG